MSIKSTVAFSVAAIACVAVAGDVDDRPVGIKIGERLTLKPYVSLSATYDSNVDGRKDGAEDVIWTVNPRIGIEYLSENWKAAFNAYYQYNAYTKGDSTRENSYHGYGEDFQLDWTDSLPSEKGWSFQLAERFMKTTQADDIMLSDGRGYSRDRQELKVAGLLMRRFNESLHANINANYYWLDYDNDNNGNNYYSGMYGWSRWSVGLEAGYALSKWTDILLSGSYSGYTQDNVGANAARYGLNSYNISDKSQSWSVMGGIGSYATERISYRALLGWTRFDYGDGSDKNDGLTYEVSGNWKIGETWNTMLLASSYYQPCESEYASSIRVDSFSWGLGKTMVRGKLTATFDLAYRRETREYTAMEGYDYDRDIISARLGLNYIVSRYITAFARVEYQNSIGSGGDSKTAAARAEYYDYNRFRGTLGLSLTY